MRSMVPGRPALLRTPAVGREPGRRCGVPGQPVLIFCVCTQAVCCVLAGMEGRIDQKFDLELRSAAGGAVQPRLNWLSPWLLRAWCEQRFTSCNTRTARPHALPVSLWTLAARQARCYTSQSTETRVH